MKIGLVVYEISLLQASVEKEKGKKEKHYISLPAEAWRANYKYNEPQSRFARLWLDSQHDNLPKGIRTIKMCKLYSNDARW